MGRICWPYAIRVEYVDGFETILYGYERSHCKRRAKDLQEKHGKLIAFAGINNNHYRNGKLVVIDEPIEWRIR